jgi:hypothetical protein
MTTRRPDVATRRTLAVLVAFLALLMPALLPFGSRPLPALGAYAAPHAHYDVTDATQPHEHGGGTESVPDAAQLLLPATLAILVVAAWLATTFAVPPRPARVAARVAVPRPFSRARPRAPPSEG